LVFHIKKTGSNPVGSGYIFIKKVSIKLQNKLKKTQQIKKYMRKLRYLRYLSLIKIVSFIRLQSNNIFKFLESFFFILLSVYNSIFLEKLYTILKTLYSVFVKLNFILNILALYKSYGKDLYKFHKAFNLYIFNKRNNLFINYYIKEYDKIYTIHKQSFYTLHPLLPLKRRKNVYFLKLFLNIVLNKLKRKKRKKSIKMPINIYLSGSNISFYGKIMLKIISKYYKKNWVYIINYTKKPHNGCRLKKKPRN
jgi:hypothetical protein